MREVLRVERYSQVLWGVGLRYNQGKSENRLGLAGDRS